MKLFNFTTLTAIGLLSSSLLAMPAFSASFDCGKASTWIEKTVCSNSELSQLDENMAKKYKAELASADNEDYSQNHRVITKNAQRQWLKFQRNTCQSEACLIREYQEYLGKKSLNGVTWGDAESLSASELPNKTAFGKFATTVNISMYNPDTQRWEDTGKVTNAVSIHKVSDKPYLAIIDGDLIFTNAHSCSLDNEKAMWSENHWVLNDYQAGKTVELRLYPAIYQGKTQLLFKDINNDYRESRCGMRGYFDGIVMDNK
ncbi:DUF1311 domain-containing protein [Psychrobacter sp. Ps5]|nr:lysozyme inhibitor LprI family protein [Psychrobacter sp. Ps5]MCG3861829.1 DUF1311 domain-containing protein [Psychrobacter sp. Ps5]